MSEFLFRGDVIFIDGTSYNFKTKTRIKNAVVDGGGQVSFSLNKKVCLNHKFFVTLQKKSICKIAIIFLHLKSRQLNGIPDANKTAHLKVSCVLSSNVLKFKESSRGETCKKLGIPVVSERYIDESTALGIKQVILVKFFKQNLDFPQFIVRVYKYLKS